jgi:hypothetical protein
MGSVAGRPPATAILYYILYIICYTMSISFGTCEYFCNSVFTTASLFWKELVNDPEHELI